MLKLLDVYSTQGMSQNSDLIDIPELVASIDVTENTETERDEMLEAVRILYGSDCTYYWHDCGHDESVACSQYPA